MKIGNVLITTASKQAQKDAHVDQQLGAVNEKLASIAEHIRFGVEQVHKEAGEPDVNIVNTTKPSNLNKSLSFGTLTGLNFYSTKDINKNWQDRKIDMQTLRFWSSELPQAPQTIEYIVKSTWARGGEFVLNEGKTHNDALLQSHKQFFARANSNKQSLKALLQTMQRHSMRVGNGYIEKIYNRAKNKLVELRIMKPWNTVVLVDEQLESQGILQVLGYAKVSSTDMTIDASKINNESKLKPWKVIHDKYIDEGDAYGYAAFERNTELTKLIISILNLNQKRFTNEIRHSLIVKLGSQATQTDADIFIAQYRARYLGPNNVGLPLITFGDIEVEVMTHDETEFDFEAFMKDIGRNHAPTLLNVSPSEILNSDAKYSNSAQGHVSTVLNTIYDWQEKIEAIINYEIMPELEGIMPDKNGEYPVGMTTTYRYQLKRENLFTMYEHLAPLSTAVRSAILSPNDARTVLDSGNLPKVKDENGQPADWADAYYMVAKDINVISEEFFAGTDDTGDVENKIDSLDGEQFGQLQSFFKKKTAQKK